MDILVMDLSIIVPVYNAIPLLERCLDSIFHQTTQYSYEVILVDDGSTDNSVGVIEARKENNIVLYRQQNAGPAAARNRGVELAKGRYIAFIDADDYWNDGYIEQTIKFLDEHKECVAVSVGCKSISLGNSPRFCPYTSNDDTREEPFVIPNFFEYWAEFCAPGTCSTTLRFEAVKQSGGMRGDLRITEDYEYWLYLSTFGQWGIIPEVFYVSDGGAVTQVQGHIKKDIERACKSPNLAEFEKRIIGRVSDEETSHYQKARGRVSRVLTYSHVITGRFSLGRIEALKYGKYFPQDKIGRLMNLAKHTELTWRCLAYLLRWREYHR
ncbi:glycosyltransferase family 2 protein [Bacteroides sp.]|uniref:glycosyltransferase family 2 protein n=2 Tax=Bacteroides sp. TaxID=29523 RepID=UPI0011DDECFC|nr:glycosyltransferase family 2 protein [Bacteroides sp.]